eukprot:PhF_6_TR37482/c0_g1_i2/m.55250
MLIAAILLILLAAYPRSNVADKICAPPSQAIADLVDSFQCGNLTSQLWPPERSTNATAVCFRGGGCSSYHTAFTGLRCEQSWGETEFKLTIDVSDLNCVGTLGGIPIPEGVGAVMLNDNFIQALSSTTQWHTEMFPQSLTVLDVINNTLKDTFPFHLLARSVNLKVLRLSFNSFRGTIPWSQLPRSLIRFDVGNNLFSGTVNVSTLPANLTHFSVSKNLFEGMFDLTLAPQTLEDLNLEYNLFEGPLRISHPTTPANLKYVNVFENNFNGTLNISYLPPNVLFLVVGENDFCGEIVFPRNMTSLQTLRFFD